MKIKIQNETVETDKLSDKKAEILECLEKLREICKKYNVTSVARVILNEKDFCGMSTVTEIPEKAQGEFDFLIYTLAQFIDKVSNSKLAVMQQSEQ